MQREELNDLWIMKLSDDLWAMNYVGNLSRAGSPALS
jgi:hypothetical protein